MISQLAHVTSLIGIEWLSHHNMDERAFQNTMGLFGTCFRFLFWFRDFLLY